MKNPKDSLILIVDDEDDLRDTIIFDFKRKGFQVIGAKSGNEAWPLLETHPVDIILTDVRMPNGDGIELLKKAKDKNIFLPVVMFITGFTDVTIVNAYDMGVDAIFSKPYDRASLFAAVDRALLSWDMRYQRKAIRLDTEIPVGLSFLKQNISVQTKTSCLGRGGMFVVLESVFPEVGENCDFRLELSHDPFFGVNGCGLVRWVRTKREPDRLPGCGIEFVDLQEGSKKNIYEFINAQKTRAFIPKG